MSFPLNRDWSDRFPILKAMDFFNHAGLSPLSGPAAAALKEYADHSQSHSYVNSHWYKRVHDVRDTAAKLIHADSGSEIAFVPNTSTGINQVSQGLDWREGDNVVITNVEFPGNRYPWEDLGRRGVQMIEVPQLPDGRIDPEDVCAAINDRTRVVAISHVQYASGYRIDLRPISEMVHRAGGYLFVDAIQSLGAIPVDVKAMGIDFLAADGRKWLMSPEGCGIFYGRAGLISQLRPAVIGWTNMVNPDDYGSYDFTFQDDARRFEPGGNPIGSILALGASMQLILDVGPDAIWARIDHLTGRICEGLSRKGYRVFSPRKNPGERSGLVIFDPPLPSVRVTPSIHQIVTELEKKNIHIVIRERRLRASPHFYNTEEQVDRLIAAMP